MEKDPEKRIKMDEILSSAWVKKFLKKFRK